MTNDEYIRKFTKKCKAFFTDELPKTKDAYTITYSYLFEMWNVIKKQQGMNVLTEELLASFEEFFLVLEDFNIQFRLEPSYSLGCLNCRRHWAVVQHMAEQTF